MVKPRKMRSRVRWELKPHACIWVETPVPTQIRASPWTSNPKTRVGKRSGWEQHRSLFQHKPNQKATSNPSYGQGPAEPHPKPQTSCVFVTLWCSVYKGPARPYPDRACTHVLTWFPPLAFPRVTTNSNTHKKSLNESSRI